MHDDKTIARMYADEACEGWHCPGFGSTDEPTEPLDTRHSLILRDVRALTGASDLRTCPMWYAGLPWVHRAVRASAWREKGQLEIVEPEPSYALVQAIDLIASGQGRQFADAMQRQREKNKAGNDG